jgi:alanyl-tRNA synthetase
MSKLLSSANLRQSFLDFFARKAHTIVPSSSLLPDSPNLLFTNAGMNQFVPIFLGQQKPDFSPGRAADTQKCIRAGGKHNDLEDVGLDTYHHTFFEMLGNWSFGDYFKKEAIEWAWELIVEEWKFPVSRLYATVYRPGPGEPAEEDAEAFGYWAGLFQAAGLDPRRHVIFSGKKDNFWMMGETGPCGPCSELHVDLTPGGDTRGALVNQGSAECIEIWNLVFIQFNANPDGSLTPLPARHVDTGMGFERVSAILQGTNGFADFRRPISNYDTDIFAPIFARLSRLSGRTYGGVLPTETTLHHQSPELQNDIAFRVIGDHIRTLSFAIADGIHPGNNDRHYVLRRILRRAVRAGRNLGLHEPFFHKLVEVLADTMGDVFPEIRARREHVEEVIALEEEAFSRTLDKGLNLFTAEAEKTEKVLSGDFAFKLYDTYGFPPDLTELMARERNLEVDVPRFEELMKRQKEQSQAAQKKEVIELSQLDAEERTEFVGFEADETTAVVRKVLDVKGRAAVLLNRSVCYAEMGGQVGDTGEIDAGGTLWLIADTRKAGQAFLHFLEEPDDVPAVGQEVTVRHDVRRRAAIARHHTVTHLLHWALHEVVGSEVSQKGSYVGPEKLSFDFNSGALTPAQIAEIENLVNERIVENAGVSWSEVPYAAVRNRAEIQQFFGDKYGEVVRVVQIGGTPRALDGYSMELCGGTHVRATGEIGLFRILSEAAIAAGTRRIEAVAGMPAAHAAAADSARLHQLAARLGTPLQDLEKRIDLLLQQHKALEKSLLALRQQQAAAKAKDLLGRVEEVGGVPLLLHEVEGGAEDLQTLANALKSDFGGVLVLFGRQDGRVHLFVQSGAAWQARCPAGKLLQSFAPLLGGKGGGKPDLARGAGSHPEKIGEACQKIREILLAS